METTTVEPVEVVSARMYAMILTSKRLKRMLLPEGIAKSPYRILDYDVTLTVHDPEGMRATFQRAQELQFAQHGVEGILDHAWGSGVVVTSYYNDAGSLADSFKDGSRHHMMIALKRAMGEGETLKFNVTRTAMASFVGDDQWWMDTTIDHPIRRLRAGIVFPKARPVQRAMLDHASKMEPLPIRTLADGRTHVRFIAPKADAHLPYLIRWVW